MYKGNLNIRETTEIDLENIRALWNDGEVMHFVGFPNGIGVDIPYLENWLLEIRKHKPQVNHYSIYSDGIGYCGETYYRIEPDRGYASALDIKLVPSARGKGIAYTAMSFAVEQAFANGATSVWVDPNHENKKAIALYRRLGFVVKPMPQDLCDLGGIVKTIYFELEKPV